MNRHVDDSMKVEYTRVVCSRLVEISRESEFSGKSWKENCSGDSVEAGKMQRAVTSITNDPRKTMPDKMKVPALDSKVRSDCSDLACATADIAGERA